MRISDWSSDVCSSDLSVRPDLVGEALAADLGQLRDRLPPFAAATARSIVAAEPGRPLDEIYASFDDTPVAAASVAQVHFAETTDGQLGAVKELRHGVADAFACDLEQIGRASCRERG